MVNNKNDNVYNGKRYETNVRWKVCLRDELKFYLEVKNNMAIKLTSIDQFEQVIHDNHDIFILKHSDTCPISESALDQFNKFLYERDMDGYYVVVQQDRALSNYIEEKTGIKHETPQALYFVEGNVAWHDSHQNINVSSLAEAEG